MLNEVGGEVTFQRKTSWSIHLIWTGFQVHGRNSRVTEFLNPKCRIRDFPYGPVAKTLLSLQGAWVQSLTGEPRSHVLHSQNLLPITWDQLTARPALEFCSSDSWSEATAHIRHVQLFLNNIQLTSLLSAKGIFLITVLSHQLCCSQTPTHEA